MTITKDEVHAIVANVIENTLTLAQCDRHHFVRTEAKVYANDAYRCTRCSGTATYTEVRWYELGVTHGEAATGGDGDSAA